MNPAGFKVQQVLYHQNGFAVSWGTRNQRVPPRAVARTGADNGNLGFPIPHGNPVWFLVPSNLSVMFLRTLHGQTKVKYREIIAVMQAALSLSK